MKTTNTEKNPRIDYLFGGNPNAIERQEAEGQKEFVASLQLPRVCNSHRGLNTAEQYHKMGIKVFTSSKEDNLFLGVKLPKGWEKKCTDHAMWNNLVDDKGRVRATIFYKAAFYDRDSFINFITRYIATEEFTNQKEPGDRFHPKFYCVKDNSTNEIIFKTDITKEYSDDSLRQLCLDYLTTNFPNHEDINAYWD